MNCEAHHNLGMTNERLIPKGSGGNKSLILRNDYFVLIYN